MKSYVTVRQQLIPTEAQVARNHEQKVWSTSMDKTI